MKKAAIGFPTSEKLVEFKCGGSLISSNFVITAAHCCQLNGDTPVLAKFGIINLKEENENSEMPQTRIISEIILHPLYNSILHYHDIALLRLQEPIVFTRYVRPIRLWALDRIPYPHVFTMGYGSTSFAKAPTNILTELDLTLVRLQECNQALPRDDSSPEGIVETQICAKDYVQKRDTCQGDSGGPLQLNLRRRSNRPGFRFYLVGIISYGEVCGSGSPGVYTRVSSYIDWIASIVWPEDFQQF
ncbi:serine protease snk [Musca autumnalis]|uniref:serine protease snk n=1 Tax=Musca autumnalis TaxID=221902 RepID=UPI003CE76FAC